MCVDIKISVESKDQVVEIENWCKNNLKHFWCVGHHNNYLIPRKTSSEWVIFWLSDQNDIAAFKLVWQK